MLQQVCGMGVGIGVCGMGVGIGVCVCGCGWLGKEDVVWGVAVLCIYNVCVYPVYVGASS